MNSLVGSCNGLICLAELTNNGIQDPIHICNPITRECLNLQGFNENNEYHDFSRILGGFGYIPQTNEYKVVRILYCDRSGRGYIQVYTLGGGDRWRYKGVITSQLYAKHGVFENGAIHWLSKNDIMAFNLTDEKMRCLPPIHVVGFCSNYSSILGSFGEWLCVSGWKSGYTNCLDIWTFKKTSSEKSIAATDKKDESWSWCMEFSITLEISQVWRYKPFAITKSGIVLIEFIDPHHSYAQTLFCYDLKTATMRKYKTRDIIEVIPHTNSFVSLKALGETSCKKRKRRSIVSSGGGNEGSIILGPT